MRSQQKTRAKNLIGLVKHLFNRQTSTYLSIFGRRGSGKTDLALLIAEIVFYNKIVRYVATNVKVEYSKFHIEPITNLSHLKEWCKTKKGSKLMILDEIGRTVSRRTPMARLNVKIINELQILRKYKLSLIIVTVDQKYTDNAILGTDLLDGIFTKPLFQNPKLALYDDNLEELQGSLRDIPKTSIKFDTWDSAPFTEKPSKSKPHISDELESRIWDWAQGGKANAVFGHTMKANREIRKYIKRILEDKYHPSQA